MANIVIQQLRQHALDWLTLAFLAILTGVLELSLSPVERVIPANDSSLAFPYLGYETVPTWLLILLAVVLPLLVIIGISVFAKVQRLDLHPGLLGLGMAVLSTLLITVIVKVAMWALLIMLTAQLTAGRLRPDFYERCQLVGGDCTGDPGVVEEGRKSFISGHASVSFAGLGYLSLYLAGKFQPFDNQGRLWKVVLVLTPLVGAYLIAISRVSNYVHHWQDVLIGGAVGYGLAYLAYRQYYPAVSDPAGRMPYSASVAPTSERSPTQAYRMDATDAV